MLIVYQCYHLGSIKKLVSKKAENMINNGFVSQVILKL